MLGLHSSRMACGIDAILLHPFRMHKPPGGVYLHLFRLQ